MFRIEKSFVFHASHILPLHDGKCRRLHGHSFVGRVVCEGEDLAPFGPKTGMLVDYTDLKALIADLTEKYLDHFHLNDSLAPFGITNPTSEVIAKWIYDQLRPFLPQIAEVQIEETCTCRAIYRPGPLFGVGTRNGISAIPNGGSNSGSSILTTIHPKEPPRD